MTLDHTYSGKISTREDKMQADGGNNSSMDDIDQCEKAGDELLIELIRSYPHIWDKKNRDHKDTDMVHNSWIEIGHTMNLSVSECQKRWTRLKQYYSKERQKQLEETSSGAGQVSRKPWPMFKCMSFMNEHIQRRRTFSNVRSNARKSLSGNEENESTGYVIQSGVVDIQNRSPLSDQTNNTKLLQAQFDVDVFDESHSSSEFLSPFSSPSRPTSAPPSVTIQTTCDSLKRPASTPLPEIFTYPSRPSSSGSTSSLGGSQIFESPPPRKFSRTYHQTSKTGTSSDLLEKSFHQASQTFSDVANRILQYDQNDPDQALVNMVFAQLKNCDGPKKAQLREKLMKLLMDHMTLENEFK